MSLLKLIDRKQLLVLGLNSGTSADGLDMVALRIRRAIGGVRIKFVDGSRRKYPGEVRKSVLECADSDLMDLDRLVQLDNLLGQFYARSAASFIKRLAGKGLKVDLIASHGQTVRHLPNKAKQSGFVLHGSLQLGSLEQIAARTGKVVVGDFRQADIALGNEGAPITVAAMARLFADQSKSRLIVNIGGMSNFFYLPALGEKRQILAADCGPGNSLCDLLAGILFGQEYDRNGQQACRGVVSQRLVTLLAAEPFFTAKKVSTGREEFGAEMAGRMVSFAREHRLPKADVMATAAELTAMAIATKIQPIIVKDHSITKLYLTGGGTHNRFFQSRLADMFDFLRVTTVRQLGYNPDLVEAAAFAVMGESCLRGEALPTRFAGRRLQRRLPVAGKIVQPPL
ncbi:MAG: hypothetical protein DRP45_01675 [Candidatus Zixiibacteriota bacterium]|nr:MAG: hypothetical protein DRP45_01675 [candidate division Zixibacteria bacterium]